MPRLTASALSSAFARYLRAPAFSASSLAALVALLLLVSSNDVAAAPGVDDPAPGELLQTAIDTDTTGNPMGGGGLLSAIDPCLEVSGVGATFDIDVVIDELHPANRIVGFDLILGYDPAVIDVVDYEMADFILPVDDPNVTFAADSVVGDTPPGEWGYFALVSGASERGEGVLVRVTFETIGAGTTPIELYTFGYPAPNIAYVTEYPHGPGDVGSFLPSIVGDGYIGVDSPLGSECDDDDADGAINAVDNCPLLANPGQADWDLNGIGDDCDTFIDSDGDGISDPIDGAWNGSTFTDESGVPSTSFTDQHLGGVSYGEIADQGPVDVRLKDVSPGGFFYGGFGPTSGLQNATLLDICGETIVHVWGSRTASVGCTNSTVIDVFQEEMQIEAGNLTAILPPGSEVVIENTGNGYTIENTFNSNAAITVNGVAVQPGNTEHDLDDDGYLASSEATIGTDPQSSCAQTPAADDEPVDSWPPDFDDNQVVNTTDVFQLLPPVLGTTVPPTSARRDLMPDGVINTTDVFQVLPPFLGTNCAMAPP